MKRISSRFIVYLLFWSFSLLPYASSFSIPCAGLPLQTVISEKDLYEALNLFSFFYAPFEKTNRLPQQAYNAAYHLKEALHARESISCNHLQELSSLIQKVGANRMSAQDRYIFHMQLEHMKPCQLSLLLFLSNLFLEKKEYDFASLGSLGKPIRKLFLLLSSKKTSTITGFRTTLLNIRYRLNHMINLQSSLAMMGTLGLLVHFFLAPHFLKSQGATPLEERSEIGPDSPWFTEKEEVYRKDITLYKELIKRLRFAAVNKIHLWKREQYENASASGHDNHVLIGVDGIDAISSRIPKGSLSEEEWRNRRTLMKQFVVAHEVKHLEHRHGAWRPLAAFALIPLCYVGLKGYNYCAQRFFNMLITFTKAGRNNILYKLKYWSAKLSTSPLVAFCIGQLLFLKFMRIQEFQADTEAIKELKTLGIDGAQGCIDFCDAMSEKDGILSSLSSFLSTHPSPHARQYNARKYFS